MKVMIVLVIPEHSLLKSLIHDEALQSLTAIDHFIQFLRLMLYLLFLLT